MKNFLFNIFEKSRRNYGAIILTLIVILIGLANFKPDTILTGWDNLHPEFAFNINIKRSIFAVWQEYQGLGLLGGMGHASDLVRQIFLMVLSVAIPMEYLRYTWTILTLLVGSLGTYIFIKDLVISYQNTKKEMYAFLGGLFYLLNLATLQTYFVPFEAFINHYAFLPWLFWGLFSYIKNPTKKHFAVMFIIFLIATPTGYIPTLFVAFLITLVILLGGVLLFTNKKKRIIVSSLKALVALFIVNAFWLLPFLYFTITSSQVNLNAKMNQMATQTIFNQNKEFGNILDVLLLKGFWFNNVDPNLSGNLQFMLQPLRENGSNPTVIFSSIFIILIILLGIINIFIKRRPFHIAIFLMSLFAITMLATNTPPFSWLVNLFRDIPLFGQAFRFPFTKFSIIAGFSYSILFVLGIEYLINIKKGLFKKTRRLFFPLLAIIAITSIALPVFEGKLFYQREQIKLPQQYLQTFDYFKKADQNARIANLPQQTFWGWNYYTWGYGGSGFLWYGIKQPILDRAFDVWSAPLENYYYELSYALYSQNPQLLEKVLNKYQVSYLLLDKNIIAPSSPKSLFYKETEKMISEISSIKKDKTFGNITIYKVALNNTPQNYLFTTPNLPSSNDYSWNNNDITYQKLGNYKIDQKPNFNYPFKGLFTNKQFEHSYLISENSNSITFTKKLSKGSGGTLKIPTYTTQNLVPIEIVSSKDDSGNTVISADFKLPVVKIDNKTVSNNDFKYTLFVLPNSGKFTININGSNEKSFDNKRALKMGGYLLLGSDNFISIKDNQTEEVLLQTIASDYFKSLSELQEQNFEIKNISKDLHLSVTIPKIIDSHYSYSFEGKDFKNVSDCNMFRNGEIAAITNKSSIQLSSINDTLCSSIFLSSLPHDESYLIHLSTQHIEGNPLHFWVLDDNHGYTPIDINLEKTNSNYLIIPRMEQYGQSYSFHADNGSIGNNLTRNTLKSMEIVSIPYSFITSLRIENVFKKSGSQASFTSTHPNESLYTVNLSENSDKTTLVLSQSYDKGWQAYEISTSKNPSIINNLKIYFPFLFGKELKNHIKVNNWENGWETSGRKNIVIVYLPQYLEYFGFLLLGLFTLLTPLVVFRKNLNTFFETKTKILKNKITLMTSKS